MTDRSASRRDTTSSSLLTDFGTEESCDQRWGHWSQMVQVQSQLPHSLAAAALGTTPQFSQPSRGGTIITSLLRRAVAGVKRVNMHQHLEPALGSNICLWSFKCLSYKTPSNHPKQTPQHNFLWLNQYFGTCFEKHQNAISNTDILVWRKKKKKVLELQLLCFHTKEPRPIHQLMNG